MSIRGNDFIAHLAYDFQKSRVTGSWDDRVSVSAKKIMLVYL
jgi:hypothetical protein